MKTFHEYVEEVFNYDEVIAAAAIGTLIGTAAGLVLMNAGFKAAGMHNAFDLIGNLIKGKRILGKEELQKKLIEQMEKDIKDSKDYPTEKRLIALSSLIDKAIRANKAGELGWWIREFKKTKKKGISF